MSRLEEFIKELCPNGVEYKKLSDICKSLKKDTLKKENLLSTGYPVINSGRGLYGYYSKYNNNGPAITIASRGNAGYVNFISNKFWAGGLCYPYTSKNENVAATKFIYYYLKSKEKYMMENLVAKAGIPALNKSDIDNFVIPVPPIEIQQKIVNILDNFTTNMEKLTEKLTDELTTRKRQYEYYRDYIINSTKYKKVSLSSVCEVYDGTHQTPKYTTSGVPFISVENIDNIYEASKFISHEDFNKFKTKPQIGDVFMTRITAGEIGRCAVLNQDIDLGYYVSLALLRPNKELLDSEYLKFYIESNTGHKELSKRILWDATPTKINKKDIGKINLILPPIDEQKKMVKEIDDLNSLCYNLSSNLSAEIEARQKQYIFYRDKLLTFKEKTA